MRRFSFHLHCPGEATSWGQLAGSRDKRCAWSAKQVPEPQRPRLLLPQLVNKLIQAAVLEAEIGGRKMGSVCRNKDPDNEPGNENAKQNKTGKKCFCCRALGSVCCSFWLKDFLSLAVLLGIWVSSNLESDESCGKREMGPSAYPSSTGPGFTERQSWFYEVCLPA